MEKLKDSLYCFVGGICSGVGGFYFAGKLLLSLKNIFAQFFCVITAVIFVYLGCVLALPNDDSRLDIKKFLIFSLGVLLTSIFIG